MEDREERVIWKGEGNRRRGEERRGEVRRENEWKREERSQGLYLLHRGNSLAACLPFLRLIACGVDGKSPRILGLRACVRVCVCVCVLKKDNDEKDK
jgi:hypothetical protein